MKLYIIRHADPDYPNNTITPAGHIEAQALARRMKKAGLTRLYSSPLGRARDTAQYTAEATGLTPEILPWTAEISVPHVTGINGNKLTVWDIEGEVIRGGNEIPTRTNWHQLPELSGFDYKAVFQGVRDSSDEFLAGLGYKREGGVYHGSSDNKEQVAVVCHGGLGGWWIAHLLEIPLSLVWCGFFLPPSSVSTILMEHRSPEIAVPRLTGLGDVSHIYAENLPQNTRGLLTNID
jgi:broad specificity phosphatase PhoE